MIKKIHCGSIRSGITVDLGKEQGIQFYGWGDLSIAENLAQSSRTRGLMTTEKFGAYGRGGTPSLEGINLITKY